MNEMYENVDYNNLKFEYVGPTKDVRFYGYMDSKELFNAMKNNQIGFSDVLKSQNELMNKISVVKIDKKIPEKKKRKQKYKAKKTKQQEQSLKY